MVIALLPSTFRRNHRNEHIGFAPRSGMERVPAAEDRRRTVARIIMQERPAAAQLVLEVRQPRSGRFLPFIVSSPYAERQSVARGYDDARRPDLDVELHHLAGLERLRLVGGVGRPVLGRAPRSELAVRGGQPSLG